MIYEENESFYVRGHGLLKLSRLLNVKHEISSGHKLQDKVEMRLKAGLGLYNQVKLPGVEKFFEVSY